VAKREQEEEIGITSIWLIWLGFWVGSWIAASCWRSVVSKIYSLMLYVVPL
jgi:hypothetical protein